MALKIILEAVRSYVGINGSHLNSCADVCLLFDPTVFCWTERASLSILGANTKCRLLQLKHRHLGAGKLSSVPALVVNFQVAIAVSLENLQVKTCPEFGASSSFQFQKQIHDESRTNWACFLEIFTRRLHWSGSEISKTSRRGMSAWVCLERCRVICQWKSIFIELPWGAPCNPALRHSVPDNASSLP